MVAINLERDGVGRIHIFFNHWHPGVFQIARQFKEYARVIHGYTGRQDEKTRVLTLPEGMNDCGHQAQHAACESF